ncbi:MAG: hypothetical protein V4494_01375 [Chlamydiota bacterium]
MKVEAIITTASTMVVITATDTTITIMMVTTTITTTGMTMIIMMGTIMGEIMEVMTMAADTVEAMITGPEAADTVVVMAATGISTKAEFSSALR